MKMKLHFSIEPDKVSTVLAALARVGVVNVVVRTEGEPERSPLEAVGFQDTDTNFAKLAQHVLEQQQQYVPPREREHTTKRGPDHAQREYAGGVRDKGISARDLVLQIFKTSQPGEVLHVAQLEAEFTKHGFKGHSYSASLSGLVKEGIIKRVSDGRYRFG